MITHNFFVYVCLTLHCASAQLYLLEVLITLYFPKLMSRFIHIPLLSHAPSSHHLYKKSICLLLCDVNLSSLAVEKDNDDASLFSGVSMTKEFSWYLPCILRMKKISVSSVVGSVVNKIFSRHNFHGPVFESLFKKKMQIRRHLKNLVFSPKSVTHFPASSVVRKVKILLNFAVPFLEVSVNVLYNFPCTASFKLPNDSLRMRKHYLVRTVIKFYIFWQPSCWSLPVVCLIAWNMADSVSHLNPVNHRGCFYVCNCRVSLQLP